MKVKIIKKQIKEGIGKNGSPYSIKSLMVSFTDAKIYDAIMANLKAQGAPEDAKAKFCSPNEHNGVISYAFFLGCSDFTFNAVERFGILDAAIIFTYANTGYINAKIQIIDRKEQVNGYEEPEQQVSGWANSSAVPSTPAPEPIPEHKPIGSPSNPFFPPKNSVNVNSLEPQAGDLPF